MNIYKYKLLEYISNNYDSVVKQGKDGKFIVIDLIPDASDENRCYHPSEMIEYCDKVNIDIRVFIKSYPMNNIGDGIRENRYVCFMLKTTEEILSDLDIMEANKTKISDLRIEIDNLEYLAETLTYEHQINEKVALLRKAEYLKEELRNLIGSDFCPKCGSKYYDSDNNVKRCQDCYTVY